MHRLQVRRGCYQYSFFPIVYPWISRNQHLRTFVCAQPGSDEHEVLQWPSPFSIRRSRIGQTFGIRGGWLRLSHERLHSHFLSFSHVLLLLPSAPSISVTLFFALSLPSHNPIPPPVYVHAWKKMKKKSYSILMRAACARQ